MPIDDNQTGRYHIDKKESFRDMQIKSNIKQKLRMKRSHFITILALGALILSLLIYSMVITISNDQELETSSKMLFSCALPPKTAKVVEVAYRHDNGTKYHVFLLVKSDLSESELQQYYQLNVFSMTDAKGKDDLDQHVVENQDGLLRDLLSDVSSAQVKNIYNDNSQYRSFYLIGITYQRKGSAYDFKNR